jgi:hypothetical protein
LSGSSMYRNSLKFLIMTLVIIVVSVRTVIEGAV